jgi:hypothetical protein
VTEKSLSEQRGFGFSRVVLGPECLPPELGFPVRLICWSCWWDLKR